MKSLPRLKPRHAYRVVWFGIVLLGLIQTWPRLGVSLGIDEPYTANLIHLSLSDIWQLHQQLGYEVTYHVLLKPWSIVFGESELALRSLSLLFYVLAVLVVSLVARQISGQRAALLAAFLLVSSADLGLVHAANARPYALLGLQVSLATLLCFQLMRLASPAGQPGDALLAFLLVLLHILGLMNHPIYLFYMAACTLAGILVSRRVFVLLAVCSLVSLVAYLLWWWPALQITFSLPRTDWMRVPGLGDLLNAYLQLWGGVTTPLLLGYAGVVLALRFRGKGQLGGSVSVSLAILSLSSLLPFVVSQLRPVFIADRTPMMFLPVACLLVAVLISQWGWRLLTGLVLAVLGAGTIVNTVHALETGDSFPTPAGVQYVMETATCGDTLILTSLSFSAVEYYWRRLDASDCIERESYPLSTQSHPGWMDVPGLLNQRAELAREAAATALRLASRPGTRVWLFYLTSTGTYRDIADILKLELDRHLRLENALEFQGLYFDSILVYSSRITEL